ncbi:UNVERIFIED_CONTAM: hypothetical protein Slati_1098300 [Sesamum latifolium]|uniref:Uncharacterized protein n=1 Tax=Sesamum latifolium TaxID=2727402 RepID=A0AAW2XEI0_9LAMI
MAMMAKRLWAVIQRDPEFIWVQWVYQVRLRERTVWTALELEEVASLTYSATAISDLSHWGWHQVLSLA